MTRSDVLAIKAYLFSLKPVPLLHSGLRTEQMSKAKDRPFDTIAGLVS